MLVNKGMQENEEKQSEVSEVKYAIGTRLYYIQKIRQLGEKLQKNTRNYKLSRMKKVELAQLMGELTNEAAESLQSPHLPQVRNSSDATISTLYRFNNIVMNTIEHLSNVTKDHTGVYLKDWAKNIEACPNAKSEMQRVLYDMLQENPWLEEYLSTTSRYVMLLVTSAMMSLRSTRAT